MATVLLSIFAHGLSAKPGIALYAKRIAASVRTLRSSTPESPGSGRLAREGPSREAALHLRGMIPAAIIR